MSNASADREIGKIIAAAQAAAQRSQFVAKTIGTLGKAAQRVAVENAVAGKNVQGRAWKPLKKGGTALRWMASTLDLDMRTMGFKVSSSCKYAVFHQRGAKAKRRSGPLPPKGLKSKSHQAFSAWKLPKRTVLPGRGLPKNWRERLVKACDGEWNALWQKLR